MSRSVNLWAMLFMLVVNQIHGQIESYSYQRAIEDISDQWHQIILPKTMFGQLESNYSDIRIFGITTDKDTVEAPYILKVASAINKIVPATFDIINNTVNKDGHYFTFDLSQSTTINQIHFDFVQQNFDWNLQLEGSNNQKEWFTIKDNYRVVSIKNQLTNYQFTSVNFPTAKYRYFRLLVKTSQKVSLNKAHLDFKSEQPATFQQFGIEQQTISTDKKNKRTLIEFELEQPLPVGFIALNTSNDFDFYRPISIQYLRDSIKTEKGWKYNYVNLATKILSSLERSEFYFNSTIAKKWKIVIENHNNPPLNINEVIVKGYEYSLIARFTEPGNYFLTYGRKNTPKPRYDIEQFSSKIPNSLKKLSLGPEQLIFRSDIPKSEPMFKNKWWMWGLMILIIFVLGWFSFKMLNE